MFNEEIQAVVSRMDGLAIGCILMDREGITLAKVGKDPDPSMDAETLGMEYSVMLKSAKKTADMVNAGAVNELFVRNEKFTTLIFIVNEEYFIALFVKPGGNMGKGRLLLRAAASRVRSDL